MGQRSRRKKRRTAPAPRSPGRGERKNEEVRRNLKPLAPGERPTAVTVGAIVAVLAAIANLVAVLVNLGSGDSQKLAGTALPVVLLLFIAWGMWRARYWAVLGMQTLLALTMVGAALAGIQAQNVRAALVVLLVLAVCGPLFWFLVKAMARIQMPAPPSAQR